MSVRIWIRLRSRTGSEKNLDPDPILMYEIFSNQSFYCVKMLGLGMKFCSQLILISLILCFVNQLFGSGSCKKVQILSDLDPDPQHCNDRMVAPVRQYFDEQFLNGELSRKCIFKDFLQCCGSESVIRCLLGPWIRDPEWVFSGSRIRILDPTITSESLKTIFWGVKML